MALEKSAGIAMAAAGGVAVAILGGVVLMMNGQTPAPSASPSPMTTAVASTTPGSAAPTETPLPTDATVDVASTGNEIKFERPYLSYELSMPPGAERDPVLAPLLKKAIADMERTKKDAAAAPSLDGQRSAMKWEIRNTWSYVAKAGDVVSLMGAYDAFTGGAHGNVGYTPLIARANGAALKFEDMFKLDKSPSPALAIAVCEAVKTAKRDKGGPMEINDAPIVCAGSKANPELSEVSYALAPSDVAGKFGGVYAIFQTYTLGPYVDGPYIVPVQHGVFGEDLRPEFKPLFGGEAPAWDPT